MAGVVSLVLGPFLFVKTAGVSPNADVLGALDQLHNLLPAVQLYQGYKCRQ
jgi:hypothetical protein